MVQGLFNKTLDEQQNSVVFEDRLFRKLGKVTPLLQQVKKVTQAMSENQDFIGRVATTVKKETKKAMDSRADNEDSHREFVEGAYRSGSRHA